MLDVVAFVLAAAAAGTLADDADPYAAVESWLLTSLELWQRANIDLQRVIIDPGIGFGKNGLQSLASR